MNYLYRTEILQNLNQESPPAFVSREMPSSPYARRYSFLRISTGRMICLQIVLLGLIVGIISISRQGLSYKCKYVYDKPLSVSVTWDKYSSDGDSSSSSSSSKDGVVSNEGRKRQRVMGFVGIQTGFGSVGRRRALRQTWFPSDHRGLQRFSLLPRLIIPSIVVKYLD